MNDSTAASTHKGAGSAYPFPPDHHQLQPKGRDGSVAETLPEVSEADKLNRALVRLEAYQARARAINAALRRAKINPEDEGATRRSREVIAAVLEDDEPVSRYHRQLWQFWRRFRAFKFPPHILNSNRAEIRRVRERLEALAPASEGERRENTHAT